MSLLEMDIRNSLFMSEIRLTRGAIYEVSDIFLTSHPAENLTTYTLLIFVCEKGVRGLVDWTRWDLGFEFVHPHTPKHCQYGARVTMMQ
jgi:hypothetical protein